MTSENRIHTRRQAEIMDAALAIVAEAGTRGLTMKRIGRRLQMTDAAIYRHFRGKRDIFLAISARFQASSNRVLAAIRAGGRPGLEQVRDFFLDRCAEFGRDRGLALVMFSDDLFAGDAAIRARHHAIMSRHRRLLLDAFAAGQAAGQIRTGLAPGHLFTMVMGSLRLLVTQWRRAGCAFDLEAEGRALWQTMESLLKEDHR